METKAYRHEVRYYECDKMGITHHSNYIRMMEEARLDWMNQIGVPFDKIEEEGIVSPVVNVSCDYIHTTTYPDIVEVKVSVAKVSALKLVLSYELSCNGKTVAKATSTHCFIKNGRPMAIESVSETLYKELVSQLQ